ncbi:unnamed protein product [Effrenium voratum]|nr:unnamed protein product [Effrenium voratum]
MTRRRGEAASPAGTPREGGAAGMEGDLQPCGQSSAAHSAEGAAGRLDAAGHPWHGEANSDHGGAVGAPCRAILLLAHAEGFSKKSDLDLGLGWWELPEHESYQVCVADATAAMMHAMQFGGSMEFGGAIKDLTGFVKEYVASCRLTCVIKRYTLEEKKERIASRQKLRTAFEEAEESRANFEEQGRVITNHLPKRRADLKTYDALHHLATQRTKNFDLQVNNSKTLTEGWLALQNVHTFQALSRLYPRLLGLEKELEDTVRSMQELTNPGGEKIPESEAPQEERRSRANSRAPDAGPNSERRR